MVTHFSLGSFFSLHGCSTSPFLTRREWKYLDGSARTAEDDPNEDAGRELKGDANGFVGAGEIPLPSPLLNGFLDSGVPGRGVVAVVEAPFPLYVAVFSMLCKSRKNYIMY